MKEVQLIPMGPACAGLIKPLSKQVIKRFPISEEFRMAIKVFVKRNNMMVINAKSFDWNPNELVEV